MRKNERKFFYYYFCLQKNLHVHDYGMCNSLKSVCINYNESIEVFCVLEAIETGCRAICSGLDESKTKSFAHIFSTNSKADLFSQYFNMNSSSSNKKKR